MEYQCPQLYIRPLTLDAIKAQSKSLMMGGGGGDGGGSGGRDFICGGGGSGCGVLGPTYLQGRCCFTFILLKG